MTGKERISRFLERAKDCERAAQQARAAPRLQKLYLEMAAQWHERTRQSWPQEDAQQQGHDLPCDDETQRRSIHVDYLEWLRKGSQMHVASPTEDGSTIEPANGHPRMQSALPRNRGSTPSQTHPVRTMQSFRMLRGGSGTTQQSSFAEQATAS